MNGLRKMDDRIVYALNTSVPTESFKREVKASEKCKELYEEVRSFFKFLAHMWCPYAITLCPSVVDQSPCGDCVDHNYPKVYMDLIIPHQWQGI